MFASRLCWALIIPLLLAACETPPPELPTTQPYDADAPAATRYKVVLIAGDGSLPVFDNAVESVAARMRERNSVAADDIQRLSAAPGIIAQHGARTASLDHVLDAIGNMKPGPGEGCFVFATSHGVAGAYPTLKLSMTGEVLTPHALDRALTRGCGNAPTAVVVSGCFTGAFAKSPMNRPNRVVLTAARADRASFGCGAGRTYTVYDECLLDAIDAGGTWRQAYVSVQHCVTDNEVVDQVTPSLPQAWFGLAIADMPLPVGAGVLRR